MKLIQLVFIALNISALYSEPCVYNVTEQSLTCSFEDQLKNPIKPDELSGDNRIQRLILKPRVPIEFSKRTIYLDDFSSYMNEQHFSIELESIKTIDYSLNPLESIIFKNFKGNHTLKIANSMLNFTYIGGLLNDKCDLNNNELSLFHPFFGFRRVELQNVRGQLCGLIFRDVELDVLRVNGMNDNNKITFTTLIESDLRERELNSLIRSVEIFDAKLTTLDASSFHPEVFAKTRRLVYEESNEFEQHLKIERNTFVGVSVLDELDLRLNNMGLFFSNEKELTWLYELNVSSTANKEMKLILTDLKKEYIFPNNDLCSFTKIPPYVVPIINGKDGLKCTCVLTRLLENFMNRTEVMTPTVTNCFSSATSHTTDTSTTTYSESSAVTTTHSLNTSPSAPTISSSDASSPSSISSTGASVPSSISSTGASLPSSISSSDSSSPSSISSTGASSPLSISSSDSSSPSSISSSDSSSPSSISSTGASLPSSISSSDSSSPSSISSSDSSSPSTADSPKTSAEPRKTVPLVPKNANLAEIAESESDDESSTSQWFVDTTIDPETNDPEYCAFLQDSCKPKTTTSTTTTTTKAPTTSPPTYPTLSFLQPTKAPNTEPASSFSDWMIVLGVLGSLVFVGIIVLFLLKYRRNQRRFKNSSPLLEDEFANIALKRL